MTAHKFVYISLSTMEGESRFEQGLHFVRLIVYSIKEKITTFSLHPGIFFCTINVCLCPVFGVTDMAVLLLCIANSFLF